MSERKDLASWQAIPRRIREAISGISPRELALRGGSEGSSIREYVHHLVEANLVAATLVIAALGSPGSKYDWSWLVPDERWMKRIGYARAPVEPALRLLEDLASHVAGLVRRTPGGSSRHVRLRGTSRTRRQTVRRVLRDEIDHARHHLRDIAAIRAARRATGSSR